VKWAFLSSDVSAAGAPAIRVLVSVPENIVNVPSESCRWDAEARPSLRSLVNCPANLS
jgi:hypothetical protein